MLSLSVNHVSSLVALQGCVKLTELYLRKNKIFDLSEIRNLANLRNLRVLWPSLGSCARIWGGRLRRRAPRRLDQDSARRRTPNRNTRGRVCDRRASAQKRRCTWQKSLDTPLRAELGTMGLLPCHVPALLVRQRGSSMLIAIGM